MGNGVKRLVHAHGQALEEAGMAFIETNARAFHTEAMLTLSVVAQRPNPAHLFLAGLDLAAPDAAVAGSAVGAAGV